MVASSIAAALKVLVEGALRGLSYGKALANGASVFVLFLGIDAAPNQIGVATSATTPVLIFILATVGGLIVVGAGGGLIKPMQHRWEGYLPGGVGGAQDQGAGIERALDLGPGRAGRPATCDRAARYVGTRRHLGRALSRRRWNDQAHGI